MDGNRLFVSYFMWLENTASNEFCTVVFNKKQKT